MLPALTSSVSLNLRPPGGKGVGKSDTSSPSCLSPGTTCLSLWKVLPQAGPSVVSALVQLPQMWDLSSPTFLALVPTLLYFSLAAPPSSGSCPCLSPREPYNDP